MDLADISILSLIPITYLEAVARGGNQGGARSMNRNLDFLMPAAMYLLNCSFNSSISPLDLYLKVMLIISSALIYALLAL